VADGFFFENVDILVQVHHTFILSLGKTKSTNCDFESMIITEIRVKHAYDRSSSRPFQSGTSTVGRSKKQLVGFGLVSQQQDYFRCTTVLVQQEKILDFGPTCW
jgi:hypothetical protein